MYKKSDQLLASGHFGEGLWPVDMESGQMMNWLIRFFSLKRGVEVGAGVGYSTGFLVSGFLVTGGKLVSLEYFLPKVEQLEMHLKALFGTEYGQSVQIVPSSFERWIVQPGAEKYDFVFFDQRKGDYLPHLKMLMPKLKKGAFICADNVLSHRDECQDYLNFVRGDKRFESVRFESEQGMELSRLR
ncbi:MAG: hypothetical protein U1C97_00940 [Candidatus Gracilibacteria bacterium]|nr:hypothetical protein [Candidatus Gracilibacteria bacterium]